MVIVRDAPAIHTQAMVVKTCVDRWEQKGFRAIVRNNTCYVVVGTGKMAIPEQFFSDEPVELIAKL